MSNTQYFVQTTHRCGFTTTGATTGTLHPTQGQQEQQHSSGLHFGAIESRLRESLEEDWRMLKRQGQGGTPASRNTPDVPPRDGETQRQPWRSRYNPNRPQRQGTVSGEGPPTDLSPQNNSSDTMRSSERAARRAGKQRAKTSNNSSSKRSSGPPPNPKRNRNVYNQRYPSTLPPRRQDWIGQSNYCLPVNRTNHVGTSRRGQQILDQEPPVSNPNHLDSWLEDHLDGDLHDYVLRLVTPVKQEPDDDWYKSIRTEAVPIMLVGLNNRERIGWQRLRDEEKNRLGWSRIVDQGIVFDSTGRPRDNWTSEELEHHRSYWMYQLDRHQQNRRQPRELQNNPGPLNDVELELAKTSSRSYRDQLPDAPTPPLSFHREYGLYDLNLVFVKYISVASVC